MPTVFSTPWFQVIETPSPSGGKPHYSIASPDFVAVVARDEQGRLLLVRQYRHAVKAMTLEVPAGHIEAGETPEQAARKELLEETGYEAAEFTLLAKLSPSTARFTNLIWCFFAPNARPSPAAASHREAGVELVLHEGGPETLLANPEFYSAGSCAAVFAAMTKARLWAKP